MYNIRVSPYVYTYVYTKASMEEFKMMSIETINAIVVSMMRKLVHSSKCDINVGDHFTFNDLYSAFNDKDDTDSSDKIKMSKHFSKLVDDNAFGIVKSDKKIKGSISYIRTAYTISKRVVFQNKNKGILHDIPGLRLGDGVRITYFDALGKDCNRIMVYLTNNNLIDNILLKSINIGNDCSTNYLYEDFIKYTEKELCEKIPLISASVYDYPITGSKQYIICLHHKFGVENNESINIWTNTETYKESGFVADINEQRIRYNHYLEIESDEEK